MSSELFIINVILNAFFCGKGVVERAYFGGRAYRDLRLGCPMKL
jgi:hypothetical protein